MRYLIKPKLGVWVASSLPEEELRDKIVRADVCISDLDETDAHSPAKKLVLENFWRRFFSDEKYCRWASRGILAKIRGKNRGEDEDAASELWKNYVGLFLPKEIRKNIAEEKFPPEKVKEMVYPGVAKFYSLLEAKKYYASRNLAEIVQQFGEPLGFDYCFGEQYDKWRFMENFVFNHPHFRKYIVKGDSEEDMEMKKLLDSCVRSRKIDYCIGIFRADQPSKEFHGFEVETGRNLEGLVEVVWGKG